MKYVLRYIVGLLLLSLSLIGHANMASPDTEGTQAGTGHFSHDIDIRSEIIDIQISKNLSSAEYTINYEVYSDKSRKQVPLVFDVDDIKGKFQISVDNQPLDSVPVKDIQSMRHIYQDISTQKSDSAINDYRGQSNNVGLPLAFEESSQFFLVDLGEGTHNITVNYTAIADENRQDWTKRYTYHYALAPAKLWKTFSNLTIKIHIEDDVDTLDWTTNLGKPQSGKLNFENEWHFVDIPQDAIVIELQKRPSLIVQMLIELNSWVVFIVSIRLFSFIHCRLIKNRLTSNHSTIKTTNTNRQTKGANKKKYLQLIVWTGIFIVPFISLLFTTMRFDFIDWLLGMHASRYHGYVVFILIFGYPFALLGYLIFIKLIFMKWVQRRG